MYDSAGGICTNITPQKEMKVPRTTQKQRSRENHPASDPETYYRTSLYIPLLDDIPGQLKTRFAAQAQKAMKLSQLVPGSPDFCKADLSFFQEALELYQPLLPRFSTQSAEGELKCWKNIWCTTPAATHQTPCPMLLRSAVRRAFLWRGVSFASRFASR